MREPKDTVILSLCIYTLRLAIVSPDQLLASLDVTAQMLLFYRLLCLPRVLSLACIALDPRLQAQTVASSPWESLYGMLTIRRFLSKTHYI